MNTQYDYGYRSNTFGNKESSEQNAPIPFVNSDAYADKTPVEADLIHETPMGGTMAAVTPLGGPVPDATPMFETPIQEIPLGGTIAPVGPLNETVVHDSSPVVPTPHFAPMSETIVAESLLVNQSIPQYKVPIVETVTHETPISVNTDSSVALINREESEHFRKNWNEIQGKFVDEPRLAVQEADVLVSEVIEHITQMFAKERSSLESQWKQGNDVSTEDLRKALKQYRSFFNRLVL